ncbi:MAG: cell wall-binding repeat-containing protein, partial [Actinobacteria bacterium]|nr:cell wall-binding repeat-containing protein [Actinomycetota bacterium]
LAIATGHGFPDALAAGCVQGKRGSVMLLTEVSALPAESSAALEDHQAEIHEVWFFGGTAAISDGVRNQVANILQ